MRQRQLARLRSQLPVGRLDWAESIFGIPFEILHLCVRQRGFVRRPIQLAAYRSVHIFINVLGIGEAAGEYMPCIVPQSLEPGRKRVGAKSAPRVLANHLLPHVLGDNPRPRRFLLHNRREISAELQIAVSTPEPALCAVASAFVVGPEHNQIKALKVTARSESDAGLGG
jgi:hypothetical protein